MSEHQIVAFRAIDGRVSDKNLEYMQKQSSRAEITPRSFDNEYHYGDFRGDAAEMLRRGYDIHLHYANYGIRTLMIRLPQGLPDRTAAAPYLQCEGIRLIEDKNGPGAILQIDPYFESGELDELGEIDGLIERLIPLRAEILNGDLRPFYIALVAVSTDSNHDPAEEIEGPVPAGLAKLTPAQEALAEFYELDPHLIAAAAKRGPALAPDKQAGPDFLTWVKTQPETQKNEWLAEWLADPTTNLRAELLNNFRSQLDVSTWPTVIIGRTMAELQSVANEVHEQAKKKAVAAAAKKKADRKAKIAADPEAFLQQTESLATGHSSNRYREISAILVEAREALTASGRADMANEQAVKLVQLFPTQTKLIGELRRHGFVPKPKAVPKAKGAKVER
jgi:hypothetical protein